MKSKINNVKLFVAVLKGITKITDKAHFDVKKNELRIRSIDPFDFCYMDIKLHSSIFDNYKIQKTKTSFGIEIGALKKLLNSIKNKEVSLEINKNELKLGFLTNWKKTYSLKWLDDDEFDLPEPVNLSYDTKFTISSADFLNLIKEASYVSREICFKVDGDSIEASAERQDFSFNTKITQKEKLDDFISSKESVTTVAILDYFVLLSDIINLSKEVTISLSKDLPLKVEMSSGLCKFTFLITNRRMDTSVIARNKKAKAAKMRPKALSSTSNIPNISVSKFPDFLKSLDSIETISVKKIQQSIHETENGSYTRLAEFLGFIVKKQSKYVITEMAKEIISDLSNNSRSAKLKIHRQAQEVIPEYIQLLNELSDQPHDVNSIVKTFSFSKSKNSLIRNKDDILILLGFATWANAVDRRLGMYYFEK